MSTPISPLAPASLARLPPIEGIAMATAEAGIRYKGRTDVLFMVMDEGTEAAGIFTKSKCPSAPVDWCRSALAQGKARALVVNSGNANAFTGRKGIEAAALTAQIAAEAVGCKPKEVLLASTGVIGEPLDATKYSGVLDDCMASAEPDGWLDAARAIMTTDTFPKLASRKVKIGAVEVTINGFAKGAGMIQPDMATMLAFVFTDAPITAPVMQSLLKRSADRSFNCVTIDGDTSTSDTLLMFATGAAAKRGLKKIETLSDPRLQAFRATLDDLLIELAQYIARDGEGARKFVSVSVTGAINDGSAKKIAFSIANSPLVKTAVAGEDANWGRVVMAVGKAGEPADRDQLTIAFGDIVVARNGERALDYSEEQTSAYMKNKEIAINVDLGLGKGNARVWTCDLTKEYVAINGDYRS